MTIKIKTRIDDKEDMVEISIVDFDKGTSLSTI